MLYKVINSIVLVLLFKCCNAHETSIKLRSVPNPISFEPNQDWIGIDGRWSSFTLRIGSPAQDIRALVSFASYQTWVVLPEGCGFARNFEQCTQSRGNVFYPNQSSTFQRLGAYGISTGSNLDLFSNADYGYDRVALAGTESPEILLTNTTVGCMALTTFYQGFFGVNPRPTNFSDFNNGSPSYISQLKDNRLISSLSAGYTAGAHYRSGVSKASLTIGGHDRARFIANDVEFAFAGDNDRNVVVGIQSITTSSLNASSNRATVLLPDPIYAHIDSTVSQLWLPLRACRAFEAEFGLVYDNNTQLYLVNNTLHEQLLRRNSSITFSLAQGLSGGRVAQITLPYAAFDLIASPPYQNLGNSSYYFPLRRAKNETQYTLGRAFLQEAYLSVNWESQRFNVSQAAWPSNATKDLIAIGPTASQGGDLRGNGGTSKGSHLSRIEIGGIVAGSVLAFLLLGILAAFGLSHRRVAGPSKVGVKLSDVPSSRESLASQQHKYISKTGAEPTVSVATSDVFGLHDLVLAKDAGAQRLSRVAFQHGSFREPSHSIVSSASQSILVSPLSAISGREPDTHEVMGDMPTIEEKDGRALTEKEAHTYREKVYNGVGPRASSATATPNADSEAIARPSQKPLDASQVTLVPTRRRRNTTLEPGKSQMPKNPGVIPMVEPSTSTTLVQFRSRKRAFSFELPTSPFVDEQQDDKSADPKQGERD